MATELVFNPQMNLKRPVLVVAGNGTLRYQLVPAEHDSGMLLLSDGHPKETIGKRILLSGELELQPTDVAIQFLNIEAAESIRRQLTRLIRIMRKEKASRES